MKYFVGFFLVSVLLANLTEGLQREFCKCRAVSSGRIVDGRFANRSAFPWQVSLQQTGSISVPDEMRNIVPNDYKIDKHYCGGLIVNENYVLTAAHCNDPYGKNEVGFGNNDLVTIYDTNSYRKIVSTIVHQGFSTKNGIQNDIALIKVDKPFIFSKTVQPACLEDQIVQKYLGNLETTGWGAFETLRDSGGPTHYTKKNGKTYVVGLVSYGPRKFIDRLNYISCAESVMYTRVAAYMEWIKFYAGEVC